jgi:hypothetical protein
MSSSSGNQGGRSTGAQGGGQSKFACRNYQQPGHPGNVWVDVYGSLCAHCQVSHNPRMVQQPTNGHISVRIADKDVKPDQSTCPDEQVRYAILA